MAKITVHEDHWPIRGTFTISRGSKTVADVIVAEVSVGSVVGRGFFPSFFLSSLPPR